MVKKLGKGIGPALVFGVISAGLLILVYSCGSPRTDSPDGEVDALGPNAACYVCHIGFVKEKISKVHLSEDVTCIHCHGLSAPHANDEDIGATPPDVTFKHDEVDTMCLECHERHKISAGQLARYESYPVCTDCHGNHRLDG
jgi:predicted CXXCH cytochrome family protein